LLWYAHRNTDVYLVSYPKCGRTWLRLMIGYALSRHFNLPNDEVNLLLQGGRITGLQVPHITVVHDDRPMLKTPDELEPSKRRYQGKKVIFLVRDPRDVIVSSYFEMKKRGHLFGDNPYESRQASFEGNLTEFINRREGGFDTILQYYNIWAAARCIPRDFLLVRYEDLKINAYNELHRVLDFLGLENISEDTITGAVEFASFENMRKMEIEGQFQSGILKPANKNDQESYKTRKGQVGGYAEYLSVEDIANLNLKLSKKLSSFFDYQT
jgi:hypothetical protein